MDTLMVLLHTKVVGGINLLHILSVVFGAILPALLGMVMPRRATVKYGMLINKIFGLILLQKRIFKAGVPANPVLGYLQALQTTFQDVSFGIYIDSRQDMSADQKQKKIDEYFSPPSG